MNKDFLVFKDEDFFKMRFNIITVDRTENIIDRFPELKLYPEFANTDLVRVTEWSWSRDCVIRYIMYAYDPMSPFQQIKDINERKNKAIDKSNLFDCPGLEELKGGSSKDANEILKCFFKILNDREYELWQTGNEFFSELTGTVREPLGELTEDKMATTFRNKFQNFKDAIALNAELRIIEDKMFAGNEDLRKMMTKNDTNNSKSGKIEQRANNKKK